MSILCPGEGDHQRKDLKDQNMDKLVRFWYPSAMYLVSSQTLVLRIIDQIRKVDLHHLPHEP